MPSPNFDPLTAKAIQIASAVVSRRWRASGVGSDDIAAEAALAALDGRLPKPPDDKDTEPKKLVWMTGRLISRLNQWCKRWTRDPAFTRNKTHGLDDRNRDGDTAYEMPDDSSDARELVDLEDFIQVRAGDAGDVIRLLATGYTNAEIAEMLDLPLSNVTAKVRRARNKGLANP